MRFIIKTIILSYFLFSSSYWQAKEVRKEGPVASMHSKTRKKNASPIPATAGREKRVAAGADASIILTLRPWAIKLLCSFFFINILITLSLLFTQAAAFFFPSEALPPAPYTTERSPTKGELLLKRAFGALVEIVLQGWLASQLYSRSKIIIKKEAPVSLSTSPPKDALSAYKIGSVVRILATMVMLYLLFSHITLQCDCQISSLADRAKFVTRTIEILLFLIVSIFWLFYPRHKIILTNF